MSHPNQSFIDNFSIANKTDNSFPIYLYSSKFKEKQRKQKFQNFVENKQSNNTQTLNEDIKKIFDYNTLSKSKSKPIFESKQSLGSLPDKFVYNGLLYQFNKELNLFVNQYNHMIAIDQATAFMNMSEFESVADVGHDSSLDGGPQESVEIPNSPTNLQITNIDGMGLFDFSWNDNLINENGYVLYVKEEK